MSTLITSVLVLAAFGGGLVAAYAYGRHTAHVEDEPRLRRARADAALLREYLPHDGAYDTEMRAVRRG